MTPTETIWVLGIIVVLVYASYLEGRKDERKQAPDMFVGTMKALWKWLTTKERKT